MMLHLPATGELLDVKALEEGEILGLNEAGHLLQWGVDIGIYTPQETAEEFGAHNVRPHELRRLKSQAKRATADLLLYPLSTQDKNTVLAALFHYHEDGLGEPFERSNEVYLLASGGQGPERGYLAGSGRGSRTTRPSEAGGWYDPERPAPIPV